MTRQQFSELADRYGRKFHSFNIPTGDREHVQFGVFAWKGATTHEALRSELVTSKQLPDFSVYAGVMNPRQAIGYTFFLEAGYGSLNVSEWYKIGCLTNPLTFADTGDGAVGSVIGLVNLPIQFQVLGYGEAGKRSYENVEIRLVHGGQPHKEFTFKEN